MKTLVTLLFCIMTSCLQAQYFSLSVTPSKQVYYVGDNIELDISITPLNNFSATIFLETKSIFSAKLSSTISNSPYSNIQCSFLISHKDIGTNTIEIIGRNGAIIEKTECTIEVLPLEYWKSVKSLVWYSSLIRNLMGRIELPSLTVDGTLRMYEYDSLDWKLKSEFKTGISKVFRKFKPFYHQAVYDSSGNLWFEVGKHIVQYDGQYFHSEELPVNIDHEDASIRLTVDVNGIVYCVASTHSRNYIARFINNKWVEINAGDISLDLIHEILVTADNSLWIKDMNDFYRVKDNTSQRIESLSSPTFVEKMCKYGNRLYCLTEKSINYFENETWAKIDLPFMHIKNNKVYRMAMAIGNRGEIYVAYSYGLSVYENGNWKNFKRETTLLGDVNIEEMIVDKANNVWMYTGKDFIVYNPEGIKTFSITSSVNEDTYKVFGMKTIDYIQTMNSLVITTVNIENPIAEVYDIQGNRIYSDNLKNRNESSHYELNTENLVNGLYLLRIGDHSAKFIIQR